MSTPSASEAQRRARRAHTKSRTGCANCKKRRVKCDELRPRCGNCRSFAIVCDYDPSYKASTSPSGPSPPSDVAPPSSDPPRRRRGRPRKHVFAPGKSESISPPDSLRSHGIPHQASPAYSSEPLPSLVDAVPELNISDLELLHHFIEPNGLAASGLGTFLPEFWSVTAVQLGFRKPFILHLILANSALHLSRLRPSEHTRLRRLAEQHYGHGLKGSTETLQQGLQPGVEPDARALFISAVLVCLCHFAMGPGENDFLGFAINEKPRFMGLSRGVKAIVDLKGPQCVSIFLLVGKEVIHGSMPKPFSQETTYIMEWEEQFDELEKFVTTAPEEKLKLFKYAFEELKNCFIVAFSDRYATLSPGYRHVFIWLYRLGTDFGDCLQSYETIPLILLAHFTVLMKTLEKHWWMDGWVRHVLNGITQVLDPGFHDWLEWPKSLADVNICLSPTVDVKMDIDTGPIGPLMEDVD